MELSPDPLLAIVTSFFTGFMRIMFATHASFLFEQAYHAYAQAHLADGPDPFDRSRDPFGRLDAERYQAYQYVWHSSCVIYATSLFDTFLSDLTLLLLLAHPGAIGRDHTVLLSEVLSTASRSEIISAAARKRAREVGYKSLAERIRYLEKTFGLDLSLDPGVMNQVDKTAMLRNAAVHDQGVFQLSLDEDGAVTATQKADPRQPSPIPFDEFLPALTAFVRCFQSIVRATANQVFHRGDDIQLQGLLESLLGGVDRMWGQQESPLRPTTR